MNDTIITFVPTGMLPRKQETPLVPITADEIVEEVLKASELGISSVHLHARDPENESPVWEKEYYEEIIPRIRKYAPELVISVTTSGRTFSDFQRRSDVLDLSRDARPDMASLTLSSLNFNKTASMNEPDMIKALIGKMNEKGIRPEFEIFDLGMVNYLKYLIRKGLAKPPYFCSLIFGNIACAQANLLHAGMLVNDLPEESVSVFGGIGNSQKNINALAIAMGYGVRVGLEDNIWFDEGRSKLASNYELLKRIHILSEAMERNICTPEKLRELLQLPGIKKQNR